MSSEYGIVHFHTHTHTHTHTHAHTSTCSMHACVMCLVFYAVGIYVYYVYRAPRLDLCNCPSHPTLNMHTKI